MASFTGAITLVGYGAARGTGSGSFTVPSGEFFDGVFSYDTLSAGTVSSGGSVDLKINITAGGSNIAIAGGTRTNESTINVALSDHGFVPLKLGAGTYTITPTSSAVTWAISGHFIK